MKKIIFWIIAAVVILALIAAWYFYIYTPSQEGKSCSTNGVYIDGNIVNGKCVKIIVRTSIPAVGPPQYITPP